MSEPRIIIYDLETIPILNEALKVWTQLGTFPGRTMTASLNSVACFGWKVFGSPDPVQVISAWDFPEWERDVNNDTHLLHAAREILSSAHGIITQNGKKFDERFLSTRFLLKDIPQLPPMHHSDNKLVAKKFYFFSNSLRYLAEQLTPVRKIENEGWDLWIKVHGGLPRKRDVEAEKEMSRYCGGDIVALEEVYYKTRVKASGANALPNHNLFLQGVGLKVCPHCGSSRLLSEGYRVNKTNLRKRYSCKDCLSWFSTDANDRLPRSL